MALKKFNASLQELQERVDALSYVDCLLGALPGGSAAHRQELTHYYSTCAEDNTVHVMDRTIVLM